MKFKNQTFTDDVTLDYNEFIDCEIKDCVVFYYGGKYSLVRTRFTNTRFGLSGPANDTLAFPNLVRANGPQLLEELLNQDPQPPPDQTVTIN